MEGVSNECHYGKLIEADYNLVKLQLQRTICIIEEDLVCFGVFSDEHVQNCLL